MADNPVASLLPTLQSLTSWFRATNTPYAIIGGVAVAVVGRARLTRDVDSIVLIDESALRPFVESGAPYGLIPRIPDPVQFARTARVLLMKHQSDGTGVDISLAGLPFEQEAIANAITLHAGGVELCVPRVEDLIIMKAVASRQNDLADIATLVDIHPRVNRRRIRRLTGAFAEVMETPEIMDRLESVLTAKRTLQTRKKKKKRRKHS